MRTLHILTLALAMTSCITGGLVQPAAVEPEEPARGWVKVDVTASNTAATADDIGHLRVIVFKSNGSLLSVEQNLTRTLPPLAAKAELVLSVERRPGETGKLVVAIANEPSFYTTQLTTLKTLDELKALELDMQYFAKPDHLGMLAATRMPMAGALWTPHIYDTQAEAEAEAPKERSTIRLKRAVARVDLLMTSDLGHEFKLDEGSFATLRNTFDRAPMVYDITTLSEIGSIQTVTTGFLTKQWSMPAGSTITVPHADTVAVCSFFTPERSCLATKLELEVGGVITGDSGTKSGTLTLNSIKKEGSTTPQSFDVVRRGNVYRVVATVRATGITATVIDWNENEIETELK